MASTTSNIVAGGALFLTACSASHVAESSTPNMVDISGLDAFWTVADQLLRDETPPDSDWEAIFATPGYALMAENDGADRTLRRMLPLALMPSRATERAELTGSGDFRSIAVEHLRGAVERRSEIETFVAELAGRDLTSEAMQLAAAWLPEGTLDRVEPPRVSFILLEPDARGYDHVVVDAAFAAAIGDDLTPTIAHEIHHVFRDAFKVVERPEGEFPERKLLQWLGNLNAEGIADQIDKQDFPKPRHWGDDPVGRIMSLVQARFLGGYERANETLAIVDAQLAAYAAFPGDAEAQGQTLSEVLILGGHPVGYHMASVIQRGFGRERLVAHFADPFSFAVDYSAAAEALGEGDHVFSSPALAGIERLRERFTR